MSRCQRQRSERKLWRGTPPPRQVRPRVRSTLRPQGRRRPRRRRGPVMRPMAVTKEGSRPAAARTRQGPPTLSSPMCLAPPSAGRSQDPAKHADRHQEQPRAKKRLARITNHVAGRAGERGDGVAPQRTVRPVASRAPVKEDDRKNREDRQGDDVGGSGQRALSHFVMRHATTMCSPEEGPLVSDRP